MFDRVASSPNWRFFKHINYPLPQAMEEVEKNFVTMRCMLIGDAEVEPNADQVLQLTQEICKEGVIDLLIHKLPVLGWEVSYILQFSQLIAWQNVHLNQSSD